MSEFNDTPFVAGSVTGVRSFDVDNLGRLRGVTHDDVWKPGENVGECKIFRKSVLATSEALRRLAAAAKAQQTSIVTLQTGLPVNGGELVDDQESRVVHRVGCKDCTCGYYAYTDTDAEPYGNPSRVRALVEGYGTVTVGERGFRAEKAKLVALITPCVAQRATHPHPRWDLWSDWNYKNDGIGTVIGVVGTAFNGVGLMMTSFAFAESSWWFAALYPVWAVMLLTTSSTFKAWRHGLDRRYPDLPPHPCCVAHQRVRSGLMSVDLFALVQRNYPDVPVYPSPNAAITDHPLTTIPDPSPTDHNFWTREAP